VSADRDDETLEERLRRLLERHPPTPPALLPNLPTEAPAPPRHWSDVADEEENIVSMDDCRPVNPEERLLAAALPCLAGACRRHESRP
jgi:hypothetical protein